jgi:hypothetical protein
MHMLYTVAVVKATLVVIVGHAVTAPHEMNSGILVPPASRARRYRSANRKHP